MRREEPIIISLAPTQIDLLVSFDSGDSFFPFPLKVPIFALFFLKCNIKVEISACRYIDEHANAAEFRIYRNQGDHLGWEKIEVFSGKD